MDATHRDTDQRVWRGDAGYYRERLRLARSYGSLLEMTCHSYVDALERNPLLGMRNFAVYLSTVYSDVSFDDAMRDMTQKIGNWIDEGIVQLNDELLHLVETEELVLPFIDLGRNHLTLCP